MHEGFRGDAPTLASGRRPRSVVAPLPPPAVDPGRAAEAALPLARALAQRTGVPLTLLSVVELEPPFNPLTRMAAPAASADEESAIAEAAAHLERVAKTISASPVETIVRTGPAAAEIRSLIAERSDPLLVLCSQTRSGLDRVLYGSVTGELVRSATCPVLVVRGSQPAFAEGVAPIHTVVAPLDRSALAQRGMARALTALGPPDLHLHLLHVLEPPAAAEDRSPEAVAQVAAAISRDLEAIAQPLRAQGYHVTSEVRTGRPAEEIAQVAVAQEAQLIALATHGEHGIAPVLLGSVAERLLQTAPVSLLLARPTVATAGR